MDWAIFGADSSVSHELLSSAKWLNGTTAILLFSVESDVFSEKGVKDGCVNSIQDFPTSFWLFPGEIISPCSIASFPI